VTGPVSFKVQLEDGRLRKCHQGSRLVEDNSPEMSQLPAERSFATPATDTVGPDTPIPQTTPESQPPQPSAPPETSSPANSSTSESNERRYPRRDRKHREHFEPGT
jgi:hypothetical protein